MFIENVHVTYLLVLAMHVQSNCSFPLTVKRSTSHRISYIFSLSIFKIMLLPLDLSYFIDVVVRHTQNKEMSFFFSYFLVYIFIFTISNNRIYYVAKYVTINDNCYL